MGNVYCPACDIDVPGPLTTHYEEEHNDVATEPALVSSNPFAYELELWNTEGTATEAQTYYDDLERARNHGRDLLKKHDMGQIRLWMVEWVGPSRDIHQKPWRHREVAIIEEGDPDVVEWLRLKTRFDGLDVEAYLNRYSISNVSGTPVPKED